MLFIVILIYLSMIVACFNTEMSVQQKGLKPSINITGTNNNNWVCVCVKKRINSCLYTQRKKVKGCHCWWSLIYKS